MLLHLVPDMALPAAQRPLAPCWGHWLITDRVKPSLVLALYRGTDFSPRQTLPNPPLLCLEKTPDVAKAGNAAGTPLLWLGQGRSKEAAVLAREAPKRACMSTHCWGAAFSCHGPCLSADTWSCPGHRQRSKQRGAVLVTLLLQIQETEAEENQC